jgi:hypothetical protein
MSRYAIKGFRFDGEPSPRIRRQLEDPEPFSRPDDDLKDVVENNVLACFQLAKYYDHLRDVADYYRIIADDLGWDFHVCMDIMNWCRFGREEFLDDKSSRYVPMRASAKQTRICRLIDDWRLRRTHEWIMTDNRRMFIAVTRKRWNMMVMTSPCDIIEEGLAVPEIDVADIDWHHLCRDRRRSLSPRRGREQEPGQYRARSSLRTHRRDDRQSIGGSSSQGMVSEDIA